MDINTILVIGFTSLFGYLIYKSLIPKHSLTPQRFGLLVAQDTGKTHHIQSKTGDASLAIEKLRRTVIQGHGRSNKSKIKETRTQLGSTTGALETFMISSICEYPSYDLILDGGDENADYCEYTGTQYLDAGDQNTKACGI